MSQFAPLYRKFPKKVSLSTFGAWTGSSRARAGAKWISIISDDDERAPRSKRQPRLRRCLWQAHLASPVTRMTGRRLHHGAGRAPPQSLTEKRPVLDGRNIASSVRISHPSRLCHEGLGLREIKSFAGFLRRPHFAIFRQHFLKITCAHIQATARHVTAI